MSSRKELTDFERGMIVGCHLGEMSVREISKQLNIPKSTIGNVLKKWKSTGDTAPKKRPGRPKILTDRNRRGLRRLVSSSRRRSLENICLEMRATIGRPVSASTTRRELHDMDFHGRAAAHKPFISRTNSHLRLAWAREHQNWTVEQWKSVLWSDESRYTLFQSDGRVWVWRMPGERLLPECVVPTVKFGGGSIMVWGCFSWYGLGQLVIVHGYMNALSYLDVLDNAACPSLWQFYGTGPYNFQHDNAPCHKARIVNAWFSDNNIGTLQWPAQSPDLNPIEHLWDELERRIRLRPRRPSSLPELATALKEEWSAISPVFYKNLVESLPRRIEAVIRAKGGPTRY